MSVTISISNYMSRQEYCSASFPPVTSGAARTRCRVTFVVDFDISPGVYFVAVALSELRRQGLHHHWMERAARFQIQWAGGRNAAPHPIKLRHLRSVVRPTPL